MKHTLSVPRRLPGLSRKAKFACHSFDYTLSLLENNLAALMMRKLPPKPISKVAIVKKIEQALKGINKLEECIQKLEASDAPDKIKVSDRKRFETFTKENIGDKAELIAMLKALNNM